MFHTKHHLGRQIHSSKTHAQFTVAQRPVTEWQTLAGREVWPQHKLASRKLSVIVPKLKLRDEYACLTFPKKYLEILFGNYNLIAFIFDNGISEAVLSCDTLCHRAPPPLPAVTTLYCRKQQLPTLNAVYKCIQLLLTVMYSNVFKSR